MADCDFAPFRDSSRPIRTLCAFLLLLAATGCGKSGNDVPVQGHVRFRGSALTRGSITFYPGAGRPVNVPLESDGSYKTALTPGDYAVTVSYTEPLPANFKEGDPIPPPKLVLPGQYVDRAKTPLKASIQPGHSEPINFELK